MAIKTTGIDHVHVFVRGLDRFLDLFGRLFESEQTLPSEIDSVEAFNSTVRFRGASSAPFLDVFEPSSEEGLAARAFARSGEGVAVLSFGVENIDEAAAHAASCGLREVSRLGFPGVMVQVQFHPADTFGFQLELVQYEPGAKERIAEIQRRKSAGEPVAGLGVRGKRDAEVSLHGLRVEGQDKPGKAHIERHDGCIRHGEPAMPEART